MASADQISCRNLGRQSWASAPTPRGGTRDGTPGRRALRVVAESRRDCPGQRRTAERLRRGREGWVGIGAEIIPKGGSNLGQSLSRPPGASSLYTREPLGTGDADRRVGPAGLLAMAMVFCHSEASVHTGLGNPSFLRWTGVRAAPRKTRGTARRVVVPYGKPDQPPKPAGAQRSVRTSGGEGMGRNRRKDHPKRGTAAATSRAALSEAESAERVAGQIQVLPDDLFVQHGVPGSVAC